MNKLFEMVFENEPTIMDKERVEFYVSYVLERGTEEYGASSFEAVEVLKELIWKLSDTFSTLNATVSKQALDWTGRHWEDNPAYVDSALSALTNMTDDEALVEQVKSLLRAKLTSTNSSEVKELLETTIAELDEVNDKGSA